MQYQIRVAGKIFQGTDLKVLLRRAVEAKRAQLRDHLGPSPMIGTGDNEYASNRRSRLLQQS